MYSPARPGRRSAARLVVGLALASLVVGACGGSSTSTASPAAPSQAPASQAPASQAAGGGGGGSASGDPASVVQDAVTKLGAKDFAGVASLACAGQADQIRNEFGLSGNLGTDLQIPGLDTAALLGTMTIDTSKVQVGSPTISGSSATVPVSGTMSMTFDKDKLRPILKQVMTQSGVTMTDQQLDTLIDSFASSEQNVPLPQSIPLVSEGGAWKICPPASGGSSGPSPAASGSSY